MEPCVSSTLVVSLMEQTSNLTKTRFVNEQVDFEHHVRSESFIRHDADSSATDSPTAYLVNKRRCY